MFYWIENNIFVTVVLSTAVLTISLLFITKRRPRLNLPPGPAGLPIIGNIHQLKSPAFLTYDKLFKQYGKIFYFRLGQRPAVYINSVEILMRCFTQNSFNDRMKSSFFNRFIRNSGVIFIDGEKWKFHRRLSLQIFRDLGMGKSLSETIVRQEARELCQYLDNLLSDCPHRSIDTSAIFSCSTMNVISLFLFSERPGYENEQFKKFMEDIHFMANNRSIFANLPVTFPILSVLTPLYRFANFTKVISAVHKMVLTQLEVHRQRISTKDMLEPSNYVEAYNVAKEQNASKIENAFFNDWQIVRLVLEFYGAGMDTSSTTLCWAAILLSLHDSVRERMAREIHNIIGKEKIVSMEDRKHFQYSLAVIDEIMRLSSIVPIILHKTREDTKIDEYDIPKDTLVMGNLYSIHHDPNIWEKPNEFYPQHFLSEDSFTYRPREHLIQFGIGKRSCLGESLARIEIFIFIITLVQRYRFHVSFDGEKGESREKCLIGTDGIIRAPGPHQIRLSHCV